MEGDTIVLQDIFQYKTVGVMGRQVVGEIVATGIRPKCIEKLAANGVTLPPSTFQ